MKHFVKSLPVLSILLALACDILLPDSAQHPAAEHPYFTWALLIGLAVYVIALLISLGNTKVRDKLSYSALFYAGAVLVLNILNLLTAKFAILPVLYFPSLDRVFGVLVEDSAFLATCLAYSTPAVLRLARRCGCRRADRYRHRLQQASGRASACVGLPVSPSASTRPSPTGYSRSSACSAQSRPPRGSRWCSLLSRLRFPPVPS